MSEPQMPQKMPFVVAEEKGGRIAWCACGRSAKQPYCDGSHRDTAFKPIVVEVEPGKRVAWCGCKRSGNQPYCDGSHKHL